MVTKQGPLDEDMERDMDGVARGVAGEATGDRGWARGQRGKHGSRAWAREE